LGVGKHTPFRSGIQSTLAVWVQRKISGEIWNVLGNIWFIIYPGKCVSYIKSSYSICCEIYIKGCLFVGVQYVLIETIIRFTFCTVRKEMQEWNTAISFFLRSSLTCITLLRNLRFVKNRNRIQLILHWIDIA
jgi:hypothetical protein